MILHGIDAPNIIRKNTLGENIADIQEKDRHHIVLANPPFGSGTERKEIKHNFTIRTKETAYLFLQHFIKKLKNNGRAAIVIKNTFLSDISEKAAAELREDLLTSCNLHTILDCPSGVFSAGVKTVILFFDKGPSTRKIWYYQINLDRNLGKTNPLNDNDLNDFIDLQKSFASSENSWSIGVDDIDKKTFDLSVNNPNTDHSVKVDRPDKVLNDIRILESEEADLLEGIRRLL